MEFSLHGTRALFVFFLAISTTTKECSSNTLSSNDFSIKQCPYPDDTDHIISPPSAILHTSQQESLLECAVSCNEDIRCKYSLFRQDLQICQHLARVNLNFWSLSSNPPSSSYTAGEEKCFVIKKILQCQNGGTSLDYTCQCPDNFTGVQCEEPNKEFCQSGNWRPASPDEASMLTTSHLQVKLALLTTQSSSIIYPLQMFQAIESSGIVVMQANHLLATTNLTRSGHFLTPLAREVKFFSSATNTLNTFLIGMTGDTQMFSENNVNHQVKIRGSIDNERQFYSGESVAKLIDGLSQGYRLLTREFTRVGFYQESGDVFFQGVRTHIAVTNQQLPKWPLYFYSYKRSLKTREKFVNRWELSSGKTVSTNKVRDLSSVDLDRCWVKMKSQKGIDGDEFNKILKEIILEGRDVRIIMEGSISTDVSTVTITTNDVIVSLADYLTPFDEQNILNSSSRIRFASLSTSKVLAECEKIFQGGGDVKTSTIQSYTGSVEWFFSSRPFSKTLTVNPDGQAIFGSAKEVVSAVNQGRDVRVCLEVTADALWTCSGSSMQSVYPDSDHMVVETPSVIRLGLHQNGTLEGIEGEACKQSVMLLSTEGWVRRAVYSLGTPFEDGDVTDVDFSTMTWFVET